MNISVFYRVFHLIVIVHSLAIAHSLDLDRRIVLHSDTDIAQEVLSLKSQMSVLESEVMKLQSADRNKDTKIAQLESAGKEKDGRISALETEVTALKQLPGGGSVYTRWGRTSCPGNGTSLVYAGYMAGTHYDGRDGPGSGADYLCLADQPTWDHYTTAVHNYIRVTAVQYSFTEHVVHVHDLADFFDSNIYQNKAPCSVCHSSRASSVMIPGKKDCYPGWTKEYSGYLVGGYPPYVDSAEYVCLDRRPESVLLNAAENGANHLFFVEAECGKGLECPPYVHDRQLACVVCTA